MYTLEEIEERGKLHSQMTAVKWIIGFGIIFPILMIVVMVVLASMTNSHSIRIDDIIGILSSIYLSPLYLILMIISTPLMGYAASKAIKKKMLEENAQEESEKREEHYRKMEELLKKDVERQGNHMITSLCSHGCSMLMMSPFSSVPLLCNL